MNDMPINSKVLVDPDVDPALYQRIKDLAPRKRAALIVKLAERAVLAELSGELVVRYQPRDEVPSAPAANELSPPPTAPKISLTSDEAVEVSDSKLVPFAGDDLAFLSQGSAFTTAS